VFLLLTVSAPSPAFALEDVDILRLLRPTVQGAAFDSIPISTCYLIDALADTRCLSHLKSTGFDYHIRADDTEDLSFVPRPHAELNAVTAAAERRGIELDWICLEEDCLHGDDEGTECSEE
jgi:hypothetical protein